MLWGNLPQLLSFAFHSDRASCLVQVPTCKGFVMKLSLGFGLVSLLVSGCAVPSGKCSHKNPDGSYTIDLDCGEDTAVTDTHTGETGDSDSDSDSDTDTDTDTDTGPIDADADGYNSEVDCDDSNADVHPDATESCNGIDDNCAAGIDEGVELTWYADGDSDGYGDVSISVDACDAPTGYVADATDCDDGDATVYPYAEEACDETVDKNCDGSFGYSDADGDLVPACEDCDDNEALAFPGGTEVCDAIDNDCDTVVDNDATDASTFYADVDGDSFGDLSETEAACTASAGYVVDATDCDDTRSDINPGEDEQCDSSTTDENCNGLADDADPTVLESGKSHLFYDADGDAYGDPATDTLYCSSPDGSWIGDFTDCDDGNAGVNPSATEVCNDVDDDCDGGVDEAGAEGETVWYVDADGDEYGDAATTADACDQPAGYVGDSTDCDDTDSGSYPGAAEVVSDGIDQDCDGMDDTMLDSDGDGDPDSTDCNSSDPGVYTGATEVCDGVDNDCSGSVDEGVSTTYFEDADGDGFGDPTSSMEDCTVPSGYTADATDCDDTRNWANPGIATDGDSSNDEYCWDTIDADCDGISGCWGGLTGSNLFGSMALWDMEDPIGTGNVSGVVMVSGTAATSDCITPASTDDCSAQLQGPGSWTVETDYSALSGSNMYCFVSLIADASSVPVTVSVYRGGTLLESVSHDTGTSWGPVSEFGLVTPASAGTITMQFTIASSNAVWVDSLDCRQ